MHCVLVLALSIGLSTALTVPTIERRSNSPPAPLEGTPEPEHHQSPTADELAASKASAYEARFAAWKTCFDGCLAEQAALPHPRPKKIAAMKGKEAFALPEVAEAVAAERENARKAPSRPLTQLDYSICSERCGFPGQFDPALSAVNRAEDTELKTAQNKMAIRVMPRRRKAAHENVQGTIIPGGSFQNDMKPFRRLLRSTLRQLRFPVSTTVRALGRAEKGEAGVMDIGFLGMSGLESNE
ncbi:MAG: hypothetical protein M1826_005688 [Phylliscum demangeonii]|nr:MAG: hypothetical protein M1826_005688 [Phylliscum demangeonii]